MSISSTVRKAGPFAGNGAQTVFPFAFKVFANSDVVVTRATAGAETVLTLGVDYTVTLNADQENAPGGNVTLTAPLAVGSSLALTSGVASLQPINVTNAGGFFPTVFNAEFDRLTILVQQLEERAGRTMEVAVTAIGVSDLTVPVLAGGVLQWSSDGAQLQAVTLPNLALSLALPSYTGNAGKLLTNDGAGAASWTDTLTNLNLAGGVLSGTFSGAATFSGALTFSSTVTLGGQLRLTGVSAPAGVSGQLNDYAPAGIATASVVKLGTTGDTYLTGVAGGVDGRMLVLENTGSAPSVLVSSTLTGMAAGSAAANRIIVPNRTYTIPQSGAARLIYDGTAQRWRLLANDRETLFSGRTYYVSTTGADTNEGLSATTAFRTIQAAINALSSLDLNGQTVTIQVQPGTYTAGFALTGALPGQSSPAQIIIQGDTVTPANVSITGVASGLGCAVFANGAMAQMQGFTIAPSTSGHGLYASTNAQLNYQNIAFGAGAIAQVNATRGAQATQIGPCSCVSAADHALVQFNGRWKINSGVTLTLIGTPAFTQFIYCTEGSAAELNGAVFSGSATGARYSIDMNSTVYTGGAGGTFLPGSIAGATGTGGQYN